MNNSYPNNYPLFSLVKIGRGLTRAGNCVVNIGTGLTSEFSCLERGFMHTRGESFHLLVLCRPMRDTMQVRLAASAKLTLTVASETGQPPTAALTAILLAVRSAHQPPLSYALHPLRIH